MSEKKLDVSDEYFLDQDNSGHWYVVEERHAIDWALWRALDDDDPRSWDVPEYASAIGGAPNLVRFQHPRIGNLP